MAFVSVGHTLIVDTVQALYGSLFIKDCTDHLALMP